MCEVGKAVSKFNYDVFSSFSVILRQINFVNERPVYVITLLVIAAITLHSVEEFIVSRNCFTLD